MALWPPAADATPPDILAMYCARLLALGNNGRLPAALIREAEDVAERIYRQRGERRRLHYCLYGRAWSLNLFGESAAAQAVLAEMESLEQPTWPAWPQSLRLNALSTVLLFTDRLDEALEVALRQQRLLQEAPGEESLQTTCQSNLCNVLNSLQRYEEAIAVARRVIERHSERRDRNIDYATSHMMIAMLMLGRLDDATATMRQALAGWRRDGLLRYVCFGLALLLALRGRLDDAARLEGVALAFYRRTGVRAGPIVGQLRRKLRQQYGETFDDDALAVRHREGEALDDGAIEALCRREAAAP
jgi:tetratricopeptide (TPR) repeat protein